MRKLIGTVGLGLLLAGLWAGSAQAVVLYDQTNNAGTRYADSTDFGAADQSTSEAADDFVVPGGDTWTINEVDVFGRFSNPGFTESRGDPVTLASSPVNVKFFADNGGVPGTVLFSASGISGDNSPDFTIPLSGPTLGPGHYWVEVQGADGNANGLWQWQTRTVVANEIAKQQFPNSQGFCTTWTDIGNCLDAGDLDLRFRLLGPDPVAAVANSPASCLGLSAEAANFHPRKPKKPFQLGVRTKFTVPEPSGVEIDASITTAGGKTESLGKHSFGDNGARKLRFALPAALKGALHRGDKVTLTMHAVVSPSSKCTGSYTQDLSLKTKVVNVQSSLLLP